jgi:hypothetical protein
MNRRHFLGGGATLAAGFALWNLGFGEAEAAYPFALSDAEWRKRLSPQAYQVLRRHSTEYAFTSPLNKEHRAGTFSCAGCGQRLFSSTTKFDSAPWEHRATSNSAMRGRRCTAPAAAGIWGMYSMTGPNPPASAIA